MYLLFLVLVSKSRKPLLRFTGKSEIYARAAFPCIFGTCPGIYFWHSPSYILVFLLYFLIKPYISYIFLVFLIFSYILILLSNIFENIVYCRDVVYSQMQCSNHCTCKVSCFLHATGCRTVSLPSRRCSQTHKIHAWPYFFQGLGVHHNILDTRSQEFKKTVIYIYI